MRNLFLVLIIPLLLTACVTEGTFTKYHTFNTPEDCEDGGTFVRIHYGDSYLRVLPIAKVKRGTALEFQLKPKINRAQDQFDYNKVLVTIKGKNANSDWIDVEGTAESPSEDLTICVDPGQAVDTYHYWVEVKEVGRLDPRADVER
jgi:hypothetical protein